MLDFKSLRERLHGDEAPVLELGEAPAGLPPAVILAAGFVAGMGAGLLLGLLIAPRSGAETRLALRSQFGPGEGDPVADEVDTVLGVG